MVGKGTASQHNVMAVVERIKELRSFVPSREVIMAVLAVCVLCMCEFRQVLLTITTDVHMSGRSRQVIRRVPY